MQDDDGNADLLKNQIRKLNFEIDKKNQEINLYLDKIHDYEEELMELHELISKTPSQENVLKLIESKFTFELKEKEKEIRDLKNRMGFLRQEKTSLQRDLEEIKITSKSSAKSIEEIREEQKFVKILLNLETLTKELRKKLYMQEIIMGNLKKEIEEKEKDIKYLNLTIKELNQELRNRNSIVEGKINKKIKKELKNGLQKELKKSKKQIDDLRYKLNKYKVPQRDKIRYDIEMRELQNKIIFLEKELEKKDRIINELKSLK